MSALWHPIPKRHDGSEMQLTETIEAVHAHNTGSSDPISDERLAELRGYLERRVAHWKPSLFPTWAAYDNLMRALACVALSELHWSAK